MKRKRLYHVTVFLLALFVFSLLISLSWTSPYVVQNPDTPISPFLEITPFIVGFLVLIIMFLLVALALEKHN